MELIQIGENRLKVMLTEEDMKRYAIEFELLDYGNTETRRAIWSILDEAKQQIGFDAARDKVYIQAFRGRAGGCELFVSCTEREDAPRRLLYAFESAGRLAAVCRHLEARRFSGEGAAFVGDDGRFYLLLEAGEEKRPDPLAFVEEFGEALPCREEFLAEHAKLLCRDAVKTLARLD